LRDTLLVEAVEQKQCNQLKKLVQCFSTSWAESMMWTQSEVRFDEYTICVCLIMVQLQILWINITQIYEQASIFFV